MRVVRTIGLAILILMPLSGCANWNGIYHNETVSELDRPTMITIDAKQREVLMVPEPTGSATNNKGNIGGWRVCAEASPDVFSALAASASGALKADVAGKSGELSAALAVAETAATIERTQAISLLRESFYRTCERYMSGAISKESFVVQSGRDARAMVGVLAIEQLTGAAKRPATIISGPATTAKAQLANNALAMLDAAQKRRRDAQTALETAKAQKDTDCSKEKDSTQCDAAKVAAPAAIAKAQAEIDQGDADIADIKQVSGAGGADLADAASSAGATEKGGEAPPTPGNTNIQQVAIAVESIAKSIIEQDDMRLFCIEKYSSFANGDNIRPACVALLAQAANAEASKLSRAIITETDLLNSVRIKVSEKVKAIPPDSYQKKMDELEKLLDRPFCTGKAQVRISQGECVINILDGGLDSADQKSILKVIDSFDPTKVAT